MSSIAENSKKNKPQSNDNIASRNQSNTASKLLLIITYTSLIVLRYFCAIKSDGYVHPDEHFQSIQLSFRDSIAANNDDDKQLKEKVTIPWEFTASVPIRSSVAHKLMSMSFLENKTPNDDQDIFTGARKTMFMWSLIIDSCAILITREYGRRNGEYDCNNRARYLPILVATSWPMFVLHVRPLTNSLEACAYALCVCLFAMVNSDSSSKSKSNANERLKDDLLYVVWGLLCSVGVFVRFTFAIFVGPLILIDAIKSMSKKGPIEFLGRYAIMAISFAVSASQIAKIDALYYDRREEFYIAPWHAFLYNAKYASEHHGKHPRVTHLLFNGFVLFGPAYVFFLMACFKETIFVAARTKSRNDQTGGVRVMALSVLASIAAMSISLHQEARFILPIMLPVLLLASLEISVLDRKTAANAAATATHVVSDGVVNLRIKFILFWLFWLAFNISSSVFYGFLHQGRISSAIWELESYVHDPDNRRGGGYDDGSNALVAFWRTYPPPNALLGKNSMKTITLIDGGSQETNSFAQKIRDLYTSDDFDYDYYYVVAPETSIDVLKEVFGDEAHLTMKRQYLGHFNSEELSRIILKHRKFPTSLDAFTLSVYEIEINEYKMFI